MCFAIPQPCNSFNTALIAQFIALWLGHESVETTQMYLHADLRQKEEALAKVTPLKVKPGRFRPDDKLLAFLETSDYAATSIKEPARFAGVFCSTCEPSRHNPGRGIMTIMPISA